MTITIAKLSDFDLVDGLALHESLLPQLNLTWAYKCAFPSEGPNAT